MRKPPENVIAVFNSTCNYRCRFCSGHRRPQDRRCWSWEDITVRLDGLWRGAKLANIGGVGEVTSLPFFKDLMEYFKGIGVRVCFSTNGSVLDPAMVRQYNLDHIVVSLHSLKPEVYDHLTGTKGKHARVLENIRALAAKPRNYRLVIVSVVTALNVGEAKALAEFVKEVGADELRFLPLVAPELVGFPKGYPDDIPLEDTPENLSAMTEACREVSDAGKRGKNVCSAAERRARVAANMKSCESPNGQMVISLGGDVLPCCFSRTVMGNIFKEPWEAIWNGDKYEAFRKAVREGTCEECLTNCLNWG